MLAMYTVLPAPLGPSACTLTVCIVALLYLTNGPETQAVELAPGGWGCNPLAATLSPADPRRRLSDHAAGAGTLKARRGLTYPITTAAAPPPARGARSSRLVT